MAVILDDGGCRAAMAGVVGVVFPVGAWAAEAEAAVVMWHGRCKFRV